MNRLLERRVERLERDTDVGDADIDSARAICHAYEMVRHHPEEATDGDRALAAATSNEDWQRAFSTLIDAAGGLGAVVQASYEIEAAEKAKQLR
jgi:thiamine biosynthesis protein ThiC